MDKIKILVVEDEAIIAKNIESKLLKAGYEVVDTVFTGNDAIKSALEKSPDIILLDIKLKGDIGGIEAAEKIKLQKDIPVIFLTSYTDEDTFEKAKLTEPAAYLSKPFNLDELNRIIQLTLFNHSIKKELVETKKRYELAVEAGRTGVWEYIPSDRKTIVDSGFLKLLGLTTEEKSIQINDWTNFVPIEELELVNSKISELISGKSDHYYFEHRIKTKDGQIRWVISKGNLIKEEESNKIKILGTITDITELKETEKKLKHYADDLKRSNTAKDNFFSIIAHDLRNPFHTILGASELLAHYSSDMSIEEIQETAQNIYRAASNVYNLLVNLLEWSRFHTGKIEVKKTQFNLCEIVNQVLELYSEQYERKNISVHTQCDDTCFVYADKYMIESVVRNLVSNAIKFTPSGKSIEVVCKNLNDDFAEFSVKDYGTGIPKEIQQKLFQIDTQISTRGTDQEKGTGLGLVLCKDFIEKNEGTISFESEFGKGSIFRVTIPKK
ncbi:Signal transduction histidine kinase [Ignavibacterium album JCM 16511]|uniref:histidine kinase n=1 Tax=Ignavibacterium album (strain DSM 19864 / JCM 16511 / NBRC 101810 / Mat9-16) TaxID=945713 RepID=I0ANA1_IGNAJ|nr:ATP-binding protein [Ignavibacterium album]AFH50458.1 Signal transduction histidine kinase [Ignavibacterium album JCM 16511]